MSQNDLSIANQGFASFRSDLNSALQALGSTNSGTSAPSTTYANQLFYDTTNNILKIRNEDNDAFISLFTLDQANDNIESLTINGALTADSLVANGGVTIDNITIDGTEIDLSSGSLTIDVASEIILDTGGGAIKFNNAGTENGRFYFGSNNLYMFNPVQDTDIIFQGNDGGSTVTALTLDMSEAGNATFNGTVTANAGVVVDNITIDGTEIDLSSGDLTLDSAGDIILDVGGADVFFRAAGTGYLQISSVSSDAKILSLQTDKDLIFSGIDGGNEIEAMRIDMSAAGRVGIGVTAPSDKLTVGGITDPRIAVRMSSGGDNNSARMIVQTNGTASTNSDAFTTYDNNAGSATGTKWMVGVDASATSFKIAAADLGNFDGTNEYFNIDSSGNVGIGATPSTKFHVKVGTNQNFNVFAPGVGTTGVTLGATTDGFGAFAEMEQRATQFVFHNGTTERMRIDSDGRVLIGRTSVGNTGNGHSIRGSDSAIFSRDSSGETMQVCRNDSTGDLIQFRRNGTICGEIVNNGSTSVAYQTSSDYRLKENVKTLANGIERIKELKPYRFNFIAEPKTIVDGFFAHEAQTVVPECASGKKDEVDENGEPVMQGIDQSKLVPLLTKALQEAVAKIETLESKITALESK